MLKVIFVIGFVAVVVQGCTVPPEVEEFAQSARSACLGTGAAPNLIEDACHGIFADDDNLKCYIKCILEHVDVIKGGNINSDMILKMLPPSMKERAAKALAICVGSSGADTCEKVFNFAKCMHKEDPEDFFIP